MTEQTDSEGRETLPHLMERLALEESQRRFVHAASAAHELVMNDAAAREKVALGLADVKEKVAALNPDLTLAVVCYAVVINPQDGEQLGVARYDIGTEAVIESILPMVHLMGEQERRREREAEFAAYPVCDDCGKRHPTTEH